MRTLMPFGFGFPLGVVLAVATTFLVVASGATSLSDLALAAVVGLLAFTSTAATAVVAWCLHSGLFAN